MTTVNFINNKEIDIKGTAQNTRKFLNKDIDKYLNLSGMHRFDICSPKLNGLPSARNDKAREEFMLRIFYAQSIVKSVSNAITNLTDESKRPYKVILVSKYVNGLQDQFVAQKIGYSDSRYRDIKRDALAEFAIKFLYYQLLNNVEHPIDLCKYKKTQCIENRLQVI